MRMVIKKENGETNDYFFGSEWNIMYKENLNIFYIIVL
jgi:hypothetical protein